MLERARCPLALADDGCHLGVAQAFDEPQQHDLPLLLAQPAEGPPQLLDLQLRLELRVRVTLDRPDRQLAIRYLVQRHIRTPQPVVVDDQIVRQPKQPGPEG